MDIKNSPIVKHAINNDKSLLPGIIAYSCKEAIVIAKRECGDFIDFAKKRTFHGNRLGQQLEILLIIIISFPSKRESDESLKITTKLHCDWHVTVESLLTNISNYETH